jgi:hypothetical protein
MAADAFGRDDRALAHRLIARANQYSDDALAQAQVRSIQEQSSHSQFETQKVGETGG